jgi:hypothetical protein
MTVKEWGIHYNRGRPHSSLGPGIPEAAQNDIPQSGHRHKLPAGYRVAKTTVLGGLHHEYHLERPHNERFLFFAENTGHSRFTPYLLRPEPRFGATHRR